MPKLKQLTYSLGNIRILTLVKKILGILQTFAYIPY